MDDILNIVTTCRKFATGNDIDTRPLFPCILPDLYTNIKSNIHVWITLALFVYLLYMFCLPDLLRALFSVFAFLIVAPLAVLKALSQRKIATKKPSKKLLQFNFLKNIVSLILELILSTYIDCTDNLLFPLD